MSDGSSVKNHGLTTRVIGVHTADGSLYRRIYIALRHRATVLIAEDTDDLSKYDLLIDDMREEEALGAAHTADARIIPLLPRERAPQGRRALPYPFAFSELYALTESVEPTARRLIIESDGRHVCLDGERIRLTESEHRLLTAMAEGNGDFVTREKLVEAAFGDGQESGILNVYVHYLREKLEHKGEKIILSSRKSGYKIDERYLGVNN